MEMPALAEEESAIFAAARSDDIQRLAQLLEAHPTLHLTACDEDGNTALHEAVRCGALLAAGCLLDAGAEANALNAREDTPVHIAASNGDLAMTKLLVGHQAKVFYFNDCGREDSYLGSGYSPLMLAANKGHAAVFNFLYETEVAQLGYITGHGRILECAAYGGNEAIIARILEREPKVLQSMWGKGALGVAVAHSNVPAVVQLLAGGAEVNAIPYYGDVTPLLSAAYCGAFVAGIHLLRHGADVTACDREGCGVLHLAACQEYKGQRALLELAIERGAEVNKRDHYGNTPLHKAAYARSLTGAKALLQAGADTRARDEQGRTPLALALEQQQTLYPPSKALLDVLKHNTTEILHGKANGQRLQTEILHGKVNGQRLPMEM